MNTGPVHALTFHQRATWGVCPDCGASPGVPCTGTPPMRNPSLRTPHHARLLQAPLRVQLSPVPEQAAR